MIAVVTGDIIGSTSSSPDVWINKLSEPLTQYGLEFQDWEIYRGDSFQIKTHARKALMVALRIKASVKSSRNLDVRMAIGMGEEFFKGKNVSQSNGTAYIRSGKALESLKKRTLGLDVGEVETNQVWNTMFDLAMLIADNWSATVASVIKATLENPTKTQKEISKMLNKSESTISETLKRGGYNEIKQMCALFEKEFRK